MDFGTTTNLADQEVEYITPAALTPRRRPFESPSANSMNYVLTAEKEIASTDALPRSIWQNWNELLGTNVSIRLYALTFIVGSSALVMLVRVIRVLDAEVYDMSNVPCQAMQKRCTEAHPQEMTRQFIRVQNQQWQTHHQKIERGEPAYRADAERYERIQRLLVAGQERGRSNMTIWPGLTVLTGHGAHGS